MVEELRLGLRGRSLVFPEGKPYCLICGKPPAGTKRVWFEHSEPGYGKVDGLAKGIQALAGRIEFEAPFCAVHRGRSILLSLGAVGCMLLAAGVVAIGVIYFGSPKKRGGVDVAKYVTMGLALIPGGFGAFLWMRKDRGGLDCEVRRDGADLCLTYPDRAPQRR